MEIEKKSRKEKEKEDGEKVETDGYEAWALGRI